MSPDPHRLDNLDWAARATGGAFGNPRLVVYAVTTIAVLLSWLLLGIVAIRESAVRIVDGPGGHVLEGLYFPPLPDLLERMLALCLNPATAGSGIGTYLAIVAMWFLMAVAMMLPSAAPLIRTYCEIVDTARGRGEATVHPVVLVAGYLSIWLAASFAFAALAVLVQAMALAQPLDPLAGLAAAAALGLAGAWQFTSLKHACLRKCRNPFAILFSRWTTRTAGVFRLGAEQGGWCLGCCWALMLVMFVVGTMNIFWMALLAVFTLVEKQASAPPATRIAGAILLVWSATLLVISTGTAQRMIHG